MKIHPAVQQLVEGRKQQRLKLGDVAEMSGFSESMLEKSECGHRFPSFSALNAWADALGYEIVLRPKG